MQNALDGRESSVPLRLFRQRTGWLCLWARQAAASTGGTGLPVFTSQTLVFQAVSVVHASSSKTDAEEVSKAGNLSAKGFGRSGKQRDGMRYACRVFLLTVKTGLCSGSCSGCCCRPKPNCVSSNKRSGDSNFLFNGARRVTRSARCRALP